MEGIEARPRFKWDIFWWMVIAAFLALGMAGCGTVPAPTDEPPSTQEKDPVDDQVAGDTGSTAGSVDAGTVTPIQTAATPQALQIMKSDVTEDLEEFKRGEVDELDTPIIESLEDQGYLTPDVARAWTEGFSYTVGDPTDNGDGTATVPVTVTVRQIGPTIVTGSTPADVAAKVGSLPLTTADTGVDFYAEPDGDWEMSPAGEQALTELLVGPMAR